VKLLTYDDYGNVVEEKKYRNGQVVLTTTYAVRLNLSYLPDQPRAS